MQALNPFTIPLLGHNLIQASAGTGKTYTISLLYLRLLLEKSLNVDQILVVTYTRAATAELRERILSRLRHIVRCYEGLEVVRGEYAELLDLYPPEPARLLLLRRALLNFDEAAIYTIHGFCQRALQENAFDVGIPFESELIADEEDLLIALADQFWHRHLLQPNALHQVLLQQRSLSPDSLLAVVRPFIGKPYLQVDIDSEIELQSFSELQQALKSGWQTMAQEYEAEADAISQSISAAKLNKKSYSPAQVKRYWQAVSAACAGARDKKIMQDVERLTPKRFEAALTKQSSGIPEHRMFAQLEQLLQQEQQCQVLLQQGYDQLCYQLLLWLRDMLPQRKLYAGLLAFDDLLMQLQQALQQRPVLAEELVQRFQVALIDEFQDTDPVQYEVFQYIYAQQGVLFFVGDPKQAIYSFRGADINTYLQAAASVSASRQYTLQRNFRSTPKLLDALNTLFAQSADPFYSYGRMPFQTVQAGRQAMPDLQAPGISAPLRFWQWEGDGEKIAAKSLQWMAAQATAQDIAHLLQAGQQKQAQLHEPPRALESRDIAVLVRSHHQGGLIKQALQTHGIVSVQRSPQGIFQTIEAQALRTLLSAMISANNEALLRRALVTPLMGADMAWLLRLDQEAELLEQVMLRFQAWRRLWVEKGFMAMIRTWLAEASLVFPEHSQQHYLQSMLEGERCITNVLHLAELIHAEARQHHLGMQAVLRWLTQQAQQAVNEDNQLRLESDAALVQIVTIHKSKGLQYPVVYCPFLWQSASKDRGEWFAWYDHECQQSRLQVSQAGREQAWQYYQQEELSESLRLLYVALTRAEYHCTVIVPTGEINRFQYNSALYWLLFGHLEQAEALLFGDSKACQPETRSAALTEALQSLVSQASPESMQLVALPGVVPEVIQFQSQTPQSLLQCRDFKTFIPAAERVASFSALTHGQHSERPDYDDIAPLATTERVERLPSQDYQVFPAGALAGTCLHKMLEDLDFQQALDEQRPLIASILENYGFDAEYLEAAIRLLSHTLQAPLREGLCLCYLSRAQRLDEMEFYFSLQRLSLAPLQTLLKRDFAAGNPVLAQAIERLQFRDVKGFMKGYIDLVFEWQGRYYIADYKSNYLGDQVEHYQWESMQRAVAEAHYYLQYLIYALALWRYLRLRLGEAFDWQAQFGGVWYLFLRGMQPLSDNASGCKEKSITGVYFDCPDESLMQQLDGLMH